ncbi:hypothetical protein HFP57_10775 [Parasphingopyxis algicola]|uniref:hypothetical protein n=1 Tax=Parasphingopyxis algicola TaxID=2026624 RepID=UPI0015A4EECA|nr:hypothetical protein [Parasphingopyxis algicola]QLC25454.1 hypothetical protein HFP57_10775 [Parasphingopyxis algicola]
MTGPSDFGDRIVQALIWIAILFSALNGAFMLFDPLGWYYAIPTVRATGPANTHFIADIGIAYLGCAVILFYAVRNLRMRWLAALAGGLWLMAHGGLHLYELMAGICSTDRFLKDAPGTIGVPLMVLIAIATLFVRQRIAPIGLPKGLFLGIVDRMNPGESEYVHEIARAPGHALEKFIHFMPASNHRHAASAAMFAATRIGAVLVEDCGPCALTAAQGSRMDGVSRDMLNAALAGGDALPEDEALAFRFGEAIARQAPDVDTLGDDIEARFGRTVRVELAMVAAMIRVYPAMKRGLGLTKVCSATKLAI